MRAHQREIGVKQTEYLIEVFFSRLFDSHRMTLRPTSNLVTPVGYRSFKPFETLGLPLPVSLLAVAGFAKTGTGPSRHFRVPEPEIKITEGTKAVINDPGVVGTAEKVLKTAFGDKFKPSLPVTASEDYSEFINASVPSMMFNIGVYEPERVAAARENDGSQFPGNHSPLFAPVPKPTIETGVEAMTLAVLSVFDQHAGGK
jgi:hypothetical protein